MKSSRELKFCLILLFSAFMGANILAINVGIQLSLYRILLIISLFYLLISKSVIPRVKQSSCFRFTAFLLFWLFYSLILLVIMVEDYSSFFRCFLFVLSALVTSVVVSLSIRGLDSLNAALRVFEFVAIILSAIGAYEILTGTYLFVNSEVEDYYNLNILYESVLGIRVPISVFRNPNDYSIFLLFAFFVSYYLSQVKDSKYDRFLSRILVLWFFFMVFATQSRASFAALVLGCFVILFHKFKHLSPAIKTIIVLLIISSFSTVVAWFISNKDLYEAFVAFDPSDAGGSDFARMNLIKNGFKIYFDSFGLGVGLGNIEYHMSFMPDDSSYIKNIHNWWLELLVSSGPFVFLFYVSIYVKAIVYFYKQFKKKVISDQSRYLALTMLLILVAYSFACITSSSVMSAEWLWAFYSLIFVAPTCIRNNEKSLSRN